MKKFIKINLIILVMFCLLLNWDIVIYATSEEENLEEKREILERLEILDRYPL